MRCQKIFRSLALLLTLAMALPGAASALTVEEARTLLKENYIDPIPEEVLSLPTIDEITAALGDPYTYYMTAEEYQAFKSNLNDSLVVGIGVMVELQVGGLLVTRVAPGSPAEKAGILSGDLLVSAQGVTIAQAGSPNALAELIPGEAGSPVTVGYVRSGETIEAAMFRAEVVFPVVTGTLTNGHIGWITCFSFGEETAAEFQEFVTQNNSRADRWVVDLRGNPGGLAAAVIETASFSIGNNDVAYIADRDLSIGAWRVSPFPMDIPPILTEPVIILVDNSSASASELYAAAMRDYGAALLIGERTFGKGIGQDLMEQADGSAMRITSFRYYAPQWVTPDKSGVLPSLVVEAGMADRVATLLSGTEVAASADVFTVQLAGFDWFVHKDAALRDKEAFAALLAALPADAPLTRKGTGTNLSVISREWGVPFESRVFTDTTTSPYRDAIDHLAILGLIEGDGKGGFTPKAQLTRAELCSLLTGAMGYWNWENERTLPFTDVSEDDWFYPSVKIMYELGLVSGATATTFDPGAAVTHQELLTILGRMGAMADLTIRERMDKLDDDARSEAQVGKFAPWARDAAAIAQSLEFTCKPLSDIDPTAPVTREEAAATLYNLMRYMKIITVTEDYVETETDAAA